MTFSVSPDREKSITVLKPLRVNTTIRKFSICDKQPSALSRFSTRRNHPYGAAIVLITWHAK